MDLLSPGDVLVDVFAGVGPFSLPAAKKGCAVLANDLNPQSYKYLVQNTEANNVCISLALLEIWLTAGVVDRLDSTFL